MSDHEQSGTDAPPAVVRVVRGHPDDAELAAVMVVLQSALAARSPVDEGLGGRPRAGGWKSYWRVLRRPIVPGRDAWRNTL